MNGKQSATLREVGDEEWRRIAPRFSDYGFEQSASYATAAAKRLGARVRFLVLDGRPGGYCLAAASVRLKVLRGIRRGIAYVPAGPLVCAPDQVFEDEATHAAAFGRMLAALRQELVTTQGHVLRLRPPVAPPLETPLADAAAVEVGFARAKHASPYRTFLIDLSHGSAETIRKRLHPKWRADLKKSLSEGLVLEIGNSDDFFARFGALYDSMRVSKGFDNDIKPAFFASLADSSFTLEVLIATSGGADVGGIVLGMAGRIAVYHFGATNEAGRAARAGYFLTWMGIQRALECGMAWYDLGGVDPTANPDGYRFKARTGAPYVEVAGPYEACSSGVIAASIGHVERLYKLTRRIRSAAR